MMAERNMCGRTWMHGKSQVVADIPLSGAAQMYRKNWDGCRDAWRENYRRMKLRRFYTDHPITPPDPEQLEYERQYREQEQAKADRFNRAQQKRYEAWLAARKNKNADRD
jgi:hypothetical protein